MSKPTLLLKGKLRAANNDPNLTKELAEWIPIEYIIEWFRSRGQKTGMINRVLVLKSETASGKSTVFPPELYKALVKGTTTAGIICTQPRVMTAIENVNEILKHQSKYLRLGENIGWSTKYNKLRPRTFGLLSATIGTLAQQLRTMTDEEIMANYKYILIDETHERDLQTDMTIYMLKNLLIRNQDKTNCPFVVLMSATFDPKSFIDYFGVSIDTNFIWCVGETAGWTEEWEWNNARTINNYTQAAATVVEKILIANPDDPPATADILIFLPGKAEFADCMIWLQKLNSKLAAEGKKVFSLLQIDGEAVQLRNRDFMRTMYIPVNEHEVIINNQLYIPSRRVILSTNVAETGLTLDNLKYVVDSGYNREIEYNPVLGIRGLITKPAPKSRIKQRRGRSGRKFPGVFYPLYPQFIYDRLPDLQLPQILIEDISSIVLDIITEQIKVKTLGGNTDPQFLIEDIDMINPPTPDGIAGALEKLYTLGFILPIVQSANTKGFNLTKLGLIAANFSMISLENIRMILASFTWGCSTLDIITIAAYLSMESFTARSAVVDKNQPKAEINWLVVYKLGLTGFISSVNGSLYKIRLLLADEFINGLVLFAAVRRTLAGNEINKSMKALQRWCDENNLSFRACVDFIKNRDEIIEQMIMAGIDVFGQENNSISRADEHTFMDMITRIKYCIYDGYRNNLLIRDGTKYFTQAGLEVKSPKLFREDEGKMAERSEYGFVTEVLPKIFLYKELNLKFNRKTSMYDVIVDKISTMDGFVSIDTDFSI